MPNGTWGCVRAYAGFAASVPRLIGLTALGATVFATQGLLVVFTWLLPLGADPRTPRHNAGMVREQVRAAERAARAAGVFRRGKVRR